MNKTLFTLLLFCSILFSSCNNEDGKEIQKKKIDYGKLHNKALDLYYSNNSNVSKLDFSEAVTKISSYMKQDDPSLFADVNAQDIVNRFNEIKSFSSDVRKTKAIDENEYTDLNLLLDYLKANNQISNDNYSFLVSNLLINESYDNKLKSINDYLATNISEYDREQIEMIKSVFISSYKYWESSGNAKVAKNLKSKADSAAVIVADCIGGLIWSGTGPGALIAAAALSLIANEGAA